MQTADKEQTAWLFEVDHRFSKLAHDRFVHYDLYQSHALPDHLLGKIDIAVVDPPFLQKVSIFLPDDHSSDNTQDAQEHVAQALERLQRRSEAGERPTLIVCTGTKMRPDLQTIYGSLASGPLCQTTCTVGHDGSRLQNDFGVFVAPRSSCVGILAVDEAASLSLT